MDDILQSIEEEIFFTYIQPHNCFPKKIATSLKQWDLIFIHH